MSVERNRVKEVVRFILELYDNVRELDDTVRTAILDKLENSLKEAILRELLYSFREPKVESREELERLIRELLSVREGENLYDVLKRAVSRSSSSHNE
jgi:methionine synthase II (cobalamin-independent)